MITTTIQLDDTTEIRIQRKVYDRWNSLQIKVMNKEGQSVFFNLTGAGYTLDHKPLLVTWEAPEHERAAGEQAHRQPRELFNVTHLNNPEDLRLREIRDLLRSYDEENETPNEILRAIHEVLFGPRADSVASSLPEPVSVEDDEIKF